MFVGRRREVTRLSTEFDRRRASLIIASGRRRVGKSRLLNEVMKDRAHVYFQATRVSSELNLEEFKTQISHSLRTSPVLEGLNTWEAVFHYLADYAERFAPGLVVALDEFPYITGNDQALPSILQRFWDTGAAERGHLKIVLCGSSIGHMRELLHERSPLYGRKTMSIEVGPLPLRDAADFFPEWPAEDIVVAYGVFGGTPYYLQACDPSRDVHENIKDLLMNETGRLYDEPNVMVQTEFREAAVYTSIIAAIAEGCLTIPDVATRLRTKTVLSSYFANLESVHLIERERSIDADDKPSSYRYRLKDPILAFWHRFVRPNLSPIVGGQGDLVYEALVRPKLSEFMGSEFEAISRDHARLHLSEMIGTGARNVGQIWGYADFDVDVAGTALDGRLFFGECKWRSDPIGISVLEKLLERWRRTRLGRNVDEAELLLFSRSGFTPELVELAGDVERLHLVDLENLSRHPAPTYEMDAPEQVIEEPPPPSPW